MEEKDWDREEEKRDVQDEAEKKRERVEGVQGMGKKERRKAET